MKKVTGVATVSADTTECRARLAAPAIGASQFAQMTVTEANGFYPRATVRGAATGAHYGGTQKSDADEYEIDEWDDAPSQTVLATGAHAWGASNVLRVTALGSSISLYDDGALVQSVTDATLATGHPGFGAYDAGASGGTIDDWSGGDVGGGHGPRLAFLRHRLVYA
jgi:hypothetical protein